MITYVSLAAGDVERRWYLEDGMFRRYVAGMLAEERPFDADDITWRGVIRALDAMDSVDLLAKLRAAFATNRAYLDKVNAGTATNADHIGQIPSLTRQVNAVLLRTVLTVNDRDE